MSSGPEDLSADGNLFGDGFFITPFGGTESDKQQTQTVPIGEPTFDFGPDSPYGSDSRNLILEFSEGLIKLPGLCLQALRNEIRWYRNGRDS